MIIAIYKSHGKPAHKRTSYRPITITNRILACMDRSIQNWLAQFAEERGLFVDEQYMQAERRTYFVILDVTSAFDSVCRKEMIVKLYSEVSAVNCSRTCARARL